RICAAIYLFYLGIKLLWSTRAVRKNSGRAAKQISGTGTEADIGTGTRTGTSIGTGIGAGTGTGTGIGTGNASAPPSTCSIWASSCSGAPAPCARTRAGPPSR
ncbi:hypothetical protein CTI14_59250, partial [Methylobacterium radiotolerans]